MAKHLKAGIRDRTVQLRELENVRGAPGSATKSTHEVLYADSNDLSRLAMSSNQVLHLVHEVSRLVVKVCKVDSYQLRRRPRSLTIMF